MTPLHGAAKCCLFIVEYLLSGLLMMRITSSVRIAGIVVILSACGATLAAATEPHLRCGNSNKPATLDLSTGVATWTLKGPGGVGPYAVVVTSLPEGWAPNQGGADWVGPTADGDYSAPKGNYTYERKMSAGNCTTPGTVTLSGFIAGDNGATIYVDGNIVSATSNYPYGFRSPNPIPFSNISFPSTGVHVLKIVVRNEAIYTGTLLQAVLTRALP
jgi:hypothetical protein